MNNSPLEYIAQIYGNVVKYDAAGNPSIFVRFPKMKSVDLDSSLPDHVHPAFIVNGVEQDSILLGKYMASEMSANGILYSLPNMPPRVSLGADPFLERMRLFGSGASGMTVADRGFILLLAKKNGWVPKGNNYYSTDYRDGTPWAPAQTIAIGNKRVLWGWEYTALSAHTSAIENRPDKAPIIWQRGTQVGGTPVLSQITTSVNNGYNTLTASGPISWYLGSDIGNLCDIVGNASEQDYGYRIVDGEIQILADNNAADPTADLGASSAAWKAILPNQGDNGHTLVAPGTSGTVHWTWVDGKLTLDTVAMTYDDTYHGTAFKDIACNSTNMPYVPAILQELGIAPISGDITQGTVYIMFKAGEFFPRRGGYYCYTSYAGPGFEYCFSVRANAGVNYAARPRLLEN